MKYIERKGIITAIESPKCVLFYYAEGCGACENIKPIYESLANQNANLNFFAIALSEKTYPFFEQYCPMIQDQEMLLNEDGTPKTDENGSPIISPKIDANGNIVMVPEITVPKILLFSNGNYIDQFIPEPQTLAENLQIAQRVFGHE